MFMSAKDRLIVALCAQLRAERDTREAFAHVIECGQLDPEVLTAIVTDPVPVILQADLDEAERLISRRTILGEAA